MCEVLSTVRHCRSIGVMTGKPKRSIDGVKVQSLTLVALYGMGYASLVPRLPQIFNVTHRKTREPGKTYHVCDVGVEAT